MIGKLLKPMEDKSVLNGLLDLAERLGVEVRHEFLGGEGGGMCQLRGKNVLFVDLAAPLTEQIAQSAAALAGLENLEEQYMIPKVRQMLEKYRGQDLE